MSSWHGFNIFERSTREPVVYNPDLETSVRPVASSTTRQSLRRKPRTTSPRVVLEPPVNESRTSSNADPSTRLLSCPFPVYSDVGVPVPANGQSLDPEEQIVDEFRSTGCSCCFDRYKNAVMDFRNSKFNHILQVLFSHIPISAVILGFVAAHQCPQASYLPGLVTAVGIVGVAFIGIWTALSCCQYRGTPFSNLQKFALAMFLGLLLIGTAIETCLVFHLSPIYDPSAQNYCSKTFHYYLIYKEMATATALLLAAMVYIPGNSLFTCCRDCPMPLPASAFFNFR